MPARLYSTSVPSFLHAAAQSSIAPIEPPIVEIFLYDLDVDAIVAELLDVFLQNVLSSFSLIELKIGAV